MLEFICENLDSQMASFENTYLMFSKTKYDLQKLHVEDSNSGLYRCLKKQRKVNPTKIQDFYRISNLVYPVDFMFTITSL